MVIKPSGVEYDVMTADDMVVVEIATVRWWRAAKNPLPITNASGCSPSLCRNWRYLHTHSRHATIWSQAAGYAWGTAAPIVPVPSLHATDDPAEEINGEYEYQTGEVIIETFEERGRIRHKSRRCWCILHGPFTSGKNAADAVHDAVISKNSPIWVYSPA
ncbi:class II aldolase/adducin family protein [Escherichia coli]